MEILKREKLITEEKYNRLVRTEEFSDEELSGFIARQLVETSQSVKAVASVLGELNPESAICYSKAENVSAFRQNFGKIKDGNRKSKNTEQLIKVREINDFHHSKVNINRRKTLLNQLFNNAIFILGADEGQLKFNISKCFKL